MPRVLRSPQLEFHPLFTKLPLSTICFFSLFNFTFNKYNPLPPSTYNISMEPNTITDRYHKSKRHEYKLSNSYQTINMIFPSFTTQAFHLLQRRCMKIDHCQIEYHPQVPYNAEGNVRIEIHDTRLQLDATLQAEYTFPVNAHIKLNFYSSSYFSTTEQIPWKASFFVQNTNMNYGTTFCKMIAHLRLSSEKTSAEVTFRPPSVELLCRNIPLESIDYRHVAPADTKLVLCRSLSANSQNKSCFSDTKKTILLPGQNFQDVMRSKSSRYSISDAPITTQQLGIQLPNLKEKATALSVTPQLRASIVKESAFTSNGTTTI